MKKQKIAFTVWICVILMILSACSFGKTVQEPEATAITKNFTLVVIDAEGTEKNHRIETDKNTVGEALMEEGLIQGEKGPYGLYVKTVDGITVDYDKDGKYWAFYIGDTYASGGVDTTEITDGAIYTLKVE